MSKKTLPRAEAELSNIAERFWSKVDKEGPVPSECADLGPCWMWTASRLGKYGGFSVGKRMMASHRVVYELTIGPIPDGAGHHGVCVLHRCDVPLCVNPGHLFLGTNKKNNDDKMRKGREARGERSGMSKLTESDVRAIRFQRALTGMSQQNLAEIYGVHKTTIAYVCGRGWAHVN